MSNDANETSAGTSGATYVERILPNGSVYIQGNDATAAERAATVAEGMPDGEIRLHFQLASTGHWRPMNHRYGYDAERTRQFLCGELPWLDALEAMALDEYGRLGDGAENYGGVDYSDTEPHPSGAVTLAVYPPDKASASHKALLRRRAQQAQTAK